MKITHEQLQAFVRGPGPEVAVALNDAAAKWGIDTQIRFAHWLAQMAQESAGFTRTRENLNYAAEALVVRFRGRITLADAQKYGRTQEHPADQIEIANRIYGGEWGAKHLGNTQAGDGSRFIGRGYKMVTGRDNYTRCSKAIYGDDTLVYRPEFLERAKDAADSAGWFWHANGLSDYADRNDIHAITMKVTGWDGTGDGAGVGFAQRCQRLARAILIL
jgi:putative chitinase